MARIEEDGSETEEEVDTVTELKTPAEIEEAKEELWRVPKGVSQVSPKPKDRNKTTQRVKLAHVSRLRSHKRILEFLREVSLASEQTKVRYQFYLFVTRAAALPAVSVPYSMQVEAATELLNFFNLSKRNTLMEEHPFSEVSLEEAQEKAEEELLAMLRIGASGLKQKDSDEFVKLAALTPFFRTRILLHEERGELVRALEVYLCAASTVQDEVFTWLVGLNQRFAAERAAGERVSEDEMQEVENLKGAILQQIKRLVKLNSSETAAVIDSWLPNSQLKVVVRDLGGDKGLQLYYLSSLIGSKEDEIKSTLEVSAKSLQETTEAKEYRDLLYKHAELLAELDQRRLVETVKKNFYPLDCLKSFEKRETGEAGGNPLYRNVHIKEALAILKKRAESLKEAVELFLFVLE